MYCAQCVNTSPNIILPKKMDLLVLREMNSRLHEQVEQVLQYGTQLDRDSELTELKDHNAVKDSKLQVREHGDILGLRMKKIEKLKVMKRNNRMERYLSNLERRVDRKRQRVITLKADIENIESHHNIDDTNSITDPMKEVTMKIEDLNSYSVKLTNGMVSELRSWFQIRKRESYEIPYTISFQPIISFENFHKLPRYIILTSLEKEMEFMDLLAQILSVHLPFTIDDCNRTGANDFSVKSVMQITHLIMNMMEVARQGNLIPKEPVDIAWLLDQYDMDHIFYNVATRTLLKSRNSLRAFEPSDVYNLVAQTLQLQVGSFSAVLGRSISTTSSSMWDQGSDTNHLEHWYVVK